MFIISRFWERWAIAVKSSLLGSHLNWYTFEAFLRGWLSASFSHSIIQKENDVFFYRYLAPLSWLLFWLASLRHSPLDPNPDRPLAHKSMRRSTYILRIHTLHIANIIYTLKIVNIVLNKFPFFEECKYTCKFHFLLNVKELAIFIYSK